LQPTSSRIDDEKRGGRETHLCEREPDEEEEAAAAAAAAKVETLQE
jgi:hypothetical protein